MGKAVIETVGGFHADALVADGPVDAAVETDREAVHVVPRVGKMDPEARGDDLALIGLAVAVAVAEFHQLGHRANEDLAFVIENTARDSADEVIELLGKDSGPVREPVSVGVLDEMDALGEMSEILDVVKSVAVEIFDALHVGGAVLRRELLAVKVLFVRCGGEAEVVRDPVGVVADVEVVGLASLRLGDVGAPLRVKAERDGIGHGKVGRPLGEDEFFRVGFGGGDLFDCHPVQLEVVPQPHVVKGPESDAAVQEGLVVRDVAGCFHVVKVDLDEPGRGGAFDFDLMPFTDLPRSARSGFFRNGDAGRLVHEKDLVRVRIGFFAEVDVVEIGRILIAEDQAHVTVAAGFLR